MTVRKMLSCNNFLNEERIKMLEEYGKDVSGLNTPEAVRDAYLALHKEINAEREEGDYLIPMLSLHEIVEYQNNIGNIRDKMSYEPPASSEPKTWQGHALFGFGAKVNLDLHYNGYYVNTENGVQLVDKDKGIAEFYFLSGLLEAVVHYPDSRGGFLALLNTNPPSREPNIIPVAFNNIHHEDLRAGIDYIKREGRSFFAGNTDSQSSSVMDTWTSNSIGTATRVKVDPPDLWDIINRELMVAIEKGDYKPFFGAGIPPGAAREAQSKDAIIAVIPIGRVLNVYDPPK